MIGVTNWTKVLGDPVDNYNKDGKEWTFDFTPDDQGLAILEGLGLGAKIKNKDDVRGKFIQFKQKAHRADGTANKPITVVDARNRPWDPNLKIGNGSKVEVKFNVVPYKATIGVYPQAIRVLELVPYERQEFAPLPEDSEYIQKADEFKPVEVIEEDVEVDEDPLNIEE